ncbi:MAG: RsmE family RNA methyltransferase [Chitinophagales bacterium]|nr:RsmE family RNA methyltransferase [Chitinophagales bacterium]
MKVFYCKDAKPDAICRLDEGESHHAITVMRLKSGDEIYLMDGKGNLYAARLLNEDKKNNEVAVEKLLRTEEKKYFLHIAIAPTKHFDRMEWFVEKAVELGINRITPIICARSERKEIKNERLEKIALAAAKQSKQLYLPHIDSAIPFIKFILTELPQKRFIAFCHSKEDSLKDHISNLSECLFMIGPEGDFTEEEIEAATLKGFQTISLGSSTLRTETAGIFVCAVLRFLNI